MPLDPQSSSIVANLSAQIHTYYGDAALNTYAYSAPIYTVPAGQPTVNLGWNNCQGKTWEDPGFAAALQNVPIPANAVPSSGSDAEIVIWQPSTNTEWEFWETAKDSSGNWSACWGGRIDGVSQNPGVFPGGTGATASGLPLLGFLIRVGELRAGSINHTINLELPQVRAWTYAWPAQRTDGGPGDPAGPTVPAEGERFRLDPSLDLSTLNLSPGELMIARAMQNYGLIVTDKSASAAIQAEDPRPYEIGGVPDPYASFFPSPQYNWLKDIPWGDLEAVAWNYGKPSGG